MVLLSCFLYLDKGFYRISWWSERRRVLTMHLFSTGSEMVSIPLISSSFKKHDWKVFGIKVSLALSPKDGLFNSHKICRGSKWTKSFNVWLAFYCIPRGPGGFTSYIYTFAEGGLEFLFQSMHSFYQCSSQNHIHYMGKLNYINLISRC